MRPLHELRAVPNDGDPVTEPKGGRMPWDTIGRVTTFVIAVLMISAVLAVVELYWPGVYRTIAWFAIGIGLGWLVSSSDRRTP